MQRAKRSRPIGNSAETATSRSASRSTSRWPHLVREGFTGTVAEFVYGSTRWSVRPCAARSLAEVTNALGNALDDGRQSPRRRHRAPVQP